jgi:hypothetical protein
VLISESYGRIAKVVKNDRGSCEATKRCRVFAKSTGWGNPQSGIQLLSFASAETVVGSSVPVHSESMIAGKEGKTQGLNFKNGRT